MINAYLKIIRLLENICTPVLLLFIRLWMARIFWYAGLSKISNWTSTLFLFQYEYKIPFLPHELSAYLATGAELGCPIFLSVGFMSRLASTPLLVMTCVIQYVYLDSVEHIYWAVLLLTIIFCGPGALSVDYIINKLYNRSYKNSFIEPRHIL